MSIADNAHYFPYGNPQLMKIASRHLMVSETECLGFQALPPAKGGESKHADTRTAWVQTRTVTSEWPKQIAELHAAINLPRNDENFRVEDRAFRFEGTTRLADAAPDGFCRCGHV